MDFVSGDSSGYYQYHTNWVATTCYQTITKTKGCLYDGGDYAGDYETVSPQVYPGLDFNGRTVYETIYETAYPYPYETAHPYPYHTVCYPETVYSTVYYDSSDIISLSFIASGIGATVTGNPVYHTMDETVTDTVTATPTPSGGLECSNVGPWIVNPSFEDSSWPGVWFPSGSVNRVNPGDDFSWVVELTNGGDVGGRVPQLEQAIILPHGRIDGVGFFYSRTIGSDHGDLTVTFS